MRRKITYYLLLLVILVMAVRSSAQNATSESSRNSYGIIAGASLNQHHGSFVSLPDVPNCGSVFTNGFGVGPDFGVFYSVPLSTISGLSFRGLFQTQSGTFNADEQFPLSANGKEVLATDRHSLIANLGRIALQPVFEYELVKNLSLFAGPEFAYVIRNNFTQTETLTQPVGGVFVENGARTRNTQVGTIPLLNKLSASIVAGAQYKLPLNVSRTLHALPQANFSFGLTPNVHEISWSTNSFVIGVGLEYTPAQPSFLPPPLPPPAPVPTKPTPPLIAARLDVKGIDSGNVEVSVVKLKVEEVYQTKLAPIIPYIFFGENSSEIPDRYSRSSANDIARFSLTSLYANDRLTLYRHILDIIGSRMANHPEAAITVTGCNDGRETELANRSLSFHRAQAVAEYLKTVWGVTPDRLHLKVRDLPERFSPIQDSDGIVENCRVEFMSSDSSILSPITISDTMRIPTPPEIHFYPSAISEAGLASWNLKALQNGSILTSFSGTSTLPKLIDWDLAKDQQHIPKAPGSVNVTLNIQDKSGQTADTAVSIPVEQRTLRRKQEELAGDYRIERFSLILFDFNSAEMTSQNEPIIRLIRSRITSKTEVTITGYCDRIGDPELNQTLSELRAKNTAKSLGVPNATIYAKGSVPPLYDNNFPEGRVYNRTVEVVLKTSLNRKQVHP